MNLPIETLERWMRLQDGQHFAELSSEMYQLWLEEIRKPGVMTERLQIERRVAEERNP